MNFNEFFNELKRRNVFKGTISYLVFSWVLLQVISILSPIIEAPVWFGKMILIILIVLLPVWVCISWFFEITTEGIKKSKNVPKEKSISQKTGQKLNTFIIAFLTLAIVLLFVDRFRLRSQQTNKVANVEKISDKTIAVLPFNDMSPNKEQGYFADGLAEELLNSLTKIGELQVTSRTSAFSFKNKAMALSDIAKALQVGYILEGSVRTYDSIIRVNVKLVETKGDTNIWSQSWEKELKNIFKIQNEIAVAVSENLQLRILDNIVPKVKEAKTEAYALFLQARYKHYNTYDRESLIDAEMLINKSIAIDSTYAPALILLGEIYHEKNNYGIINFSDAKRLTKNMARQAIEQDSTYAEAYAFKALLALEYDRNINLASAFVSQALTLEPNNITGLERASEIALLKGNVEKAIDFKKLIIELDPVNESNFYGLANTLNFAKRYKEAEAAILESIRLEPKQEMSYYLYALTLLNQQKYDEALIVIEKEPLEGFKLHLKGVIYHFIRDKEKSDLAIKTLIDQHQKAWSFQIASTYALINKPKEMYFWLDKAKEYNDLGLIELPVEPAFEPYKNETRFIKFIESLDYKY
ncbi:tetratricopeptide repeat protein [Patiriisocius marinus]|uniref:Uncharacterized protein n=1 Tax=Patiriisocius marinus TaxID=1397112 RepID=A0A5J4J3I3_9FLAO|nr:CDC27 family protein [Patiriisocius marinus]GER60443.1 hypothetical protein ULMA_25510 [Patiriisocius marinus]